MEGSGIRKMVLNTKPEVRRGVGRPKLRWLGDGGTDLKTLDVRKMETKSSRVKSVDANLVDAKANQTEP